MPELPAVSVVIPSYQSASTIEAALASVEGQRYEGPREVIVVRTGPDDGADERVRSHPKARLVTRPERAHAGAARNLGASKAGGEILAFLDADCEARSGWLLSMAKAAELGARAQGGAIDTAAPKTLPARAEEFLETLEFHPRGRPRRLPFASAANSAYDAEVFRSVSGFADVKLGEDLLLGEKLRAKGIPIAFNPEMVVLHRNRVALRRFLAKQREHGRYSAEVRRRASMNGSLFVRAPWLLPLLPMARMLRLTSRAASISPSLLLSLLALSPLVALGIASWTWGFCQSKSHGE